jgi:hypothetical protein
MATIVNGAKAVWSGRLIGATPTQAEPKFVGWGTGTTAEAATQTALVTAAAEARVSGTSSQVTVTQTNDTYQVVATITSASAQTIAEEGQFDAATAGTMVMRHVFTGVALAIGDAIQMTNRIQFS